jgi:2-polyprenyl-3-methyl-5-hydroxy-6-metoxy-1,4-benzoquinol methylase
MDVLELGCGTGTTALHHAPHVKHIRAVDISAKMLEIARAKAEAAGVTNVTFETASVEDLRSTAETYDVVMVHSLLHLLDDRAAALAEIHRVLKPGGLLVSSTVCLGGGLPWLRLLIPVMRVLGLAPRVWFLTPDALTAEVEAAGFRIAHSWRHGRMTSLFLMARKA